MHDSNILAIQSEELGVVGEAGRVDHLRKDRVVHDLGEFLGSHATNCRAKSLEALVCGGEDCKIGGIEGSAYETCRIEGAFKCCEIEGVRSISDVGWRDQEGINNLDHSSVEL